MTPGETDAVAASFLEWYAANRADSQVAAAALERYIAQVLADDNLRTLVVNARAKTIESVREKLLRKPFRRPRSQLTDRLGARVIVYHAREVDAVAALLRGKLQIREADSSDKRLALGLREFGYRSYHLVASLPQTAAVPPQLWSLRGQVFEIQIRSLLEHVWAEIEHDVVYKSGADWPDEIKRRFASIAGVLELLEHEFDQLTEAASRVVDEACESLRQHMNWARNLDVPSMCALMEIEHPGGLSFRGARVAGSPFPPGIEQLLHLALRRSQIATVGALLRTLRSPRIRGSVRRYARAEGILGDEVSHLAILALVVGMRSPVALRVFFPEFAAESSMRVALGQRR